MKIITPGNIEREDMFSYISEKLHELRKEIKKTNKDKKKVKLMNEYVILDGMRKELEKGKVIEKVVVEKSATTTPIQEKTKKRERPVLDLSMNGMILYNQLEINLEHGFTTFKLNIDDCHELFDTDKASGSAFEKILNAVQKELNEKADLTFYFMKEYGINEKNTKVIEGFRICTLEKPEEQLKLLNI